MRKFSLLLLLASPMFGQNGNTACETLAKINLLVQSEHYQPKPVDDSLSVFVFDALLEKLDPYRNTFIDREYKALCMHRSSIDDYMASGDCSFVDEIVTTYKAGLKRKLSIIEKVRQTPLDYKSADSMRYTRSVFPFTADETELQRVINKRIRFEVMEDIAKISANKDSLASKFQKLQKNSADQIFEANLCKVTALIESDLHNTISEDLFNIFCTYFDPHSNYFSIDGKDSFMSALTTSGLSLGFNVSLTDNKEIVIAEVIPGGPAAKSEKIDKGDVIVKVANSKGKSFTVTCTTLESIGNLLFSDSNKSVAVTLRKSNGLLVDVSLTKQVMSADDHSVYSFIIEDGIRAGYIRIPTFYSDFETGTVSGVADDVAKELVKLQQDKIDGLIIDLYDNGGGAVDEAAKLSGMFIDYGPVAVLEDNTAKQTIMKDMNRGTAYSGPIVVLINGKSASASEFFAGVMQDFNRAIVAGSRSLGKASMQAILPLDASEQQFVKLSMQKFYRITGDSNQVNGIIPDVALPVLFDNIVEREEDLVTALPYKRIATKTRFQPYPQQLEAVKAKSIARVQQDPRFNTIAKINQEIESIFKGKKAPVRMTFDDIFAAVHERDPLWERVAAVAEQQIGSTVLNTAYTSEKMQFDTFLQETNKYKLQNVKSNPYVEEAVRIIHDLKLTNP